MDGYKEILGICIGQNENSKFWLGVLNELKRLGIQDVYLSCSDDSLRKMLYLASNNIVKKGLFVNRSANRSATASKRKKAFAITCEGLNLLERVNGFKPSTHGLGSWFHNLPMILFASADFEGAVDLFY